MLSAVVFLAQKDAEGCLGNPQAALSRSLAALVPGLVAGLIRDVTIAGPRDLQLPAIAEHAGCGLMEAGRESDWLCEALALSKHSACLVLQAGFLPGTGFVEELQDWADAAWHQAGVFRAEPRRWPERLFPGLAQTAAAIAPLEVWQPRTLQPFGCKARALKGRVMRTRMHSTS